MPAPVLRPIAKAQIRAVPARFRSLKLEQP